MINLFCEGICTVSKLEQKIRLFVENDDCMIIVDNYVYFLNLKHGFYFKIESIREPMRQRVKRTLKILNNIKLLNNVHKEQNTLINFDPYKIHIPGEIENIEWKQSPKKNSRSVRSNYNYFNLDVFQSLADKSEILINSID